MNQKNLSATSNNRKLLKNYLKDRKILTIFKKFEKNLNGLKKNFVVAVSGGPDSLALAYLSKILSVKTNLKPKFYIIDHKLRTESSNEASRVKKILKKKSINSKILIWKGKKPLNNIQSTARKKRFELILNECKKNKINNILLGHHIDDLYENFFLRILRGSGLNGLVSFDKETIFEKFKIYRPLVDFEKKDLVYIANKVFNFYINDPSNENEKFKRTKIRNYLEFLKNEGLNKKKLLLTIKNLKDSNSSINYYVNQNLRKNIFFNKKNNTYLLNFNFFNQSHEVIFRSLSEIIKKMGKKYYPVRGKSLDLLILKILKNSIFKSTLGGCLIEKIDQTVIISKEK